MKFEIKSREGLPIRGNFDVAPNARALVVIVHGFKGFKDWGFFPWLGEYLAANRMVACRFNMSRSGIGEEQESFDRLDLFAGDTYSAQVNDCVDVVTHAQSRFSGLPTFLLGHSRGGGVALLASRLLDDVRGVVTWSAISTVDRWDDATKQTWRRDGHLDVINARTRQVMRMSPAILDDYDANASQLDILSAARDLEAPLLALHGSKDESVPVDEAGRIVAAARDASLVVIESASHTYNAIHPLVHVPKELEYAAAVSAAFVGAYAAVRSSRPIAANRS